MKLLLLLLLLIPEARGTFPALPNSTCSAITATMGSYYYSSSLVPAWIEYIQDGVRWNNSNNQCLYCPYHEEPVTQVTWDRELEPMYGPCLNLARSLPLQCIQLPDSGVTQNMTLRPEAFYGKLFFPEQRPLYTEFAGEHANELMDRYSNRTTRVGYPYPVHMLLQPQNNLQSSLSPSMYGVTKTHFQEVWGCTTECDTNWISITQQLCDYGCHRKQSLVQVHVTAAEAESHMELLPEDQEVMVCRDCPPGHTSYWWPDQLYNNGNDYKKDVPMPLRAWPFTSQCWPFLGVQPNVVWNNAKKLYDFVGGKDRGKACPVNTYWRSCAHYFLLSKRLNNGTETPCHPCPAGFDTRGKTGQWYCTPPPGTIFTYPPNFKYDYVNLRTLTQEPQCVTCQLPECARSDINNDAEKYNEIMIFSKLLATKSCPEGYYCPDPFQDIPQQRCAAPFTLSPAGSSSQENCTCGLGQYRVNSTACLPCTTTCAVGSKLRLADCATKLGATQDAQCSACNLPPNASPVQLQDPTSGKWYYFRDVYVGTTVTAECHFQCNQGYYLGGDKTCKPLNASNTDGQPLFLKNDAYNPVYFPDLHVIPGLDTYNVITQSTLSGVMVYVTLKANTFSESQSWCPALPNGTAQWAPDGWTWNSDLQCVPCSPKPDGVAWSDSALTWSPAMGSALACTWKCNNSSQYLQGRTCVACASACTGNTSAQGLGCGGSQATIITCVNCTLPACPSGQWLNLHSAQGGCACESCTQLQNQKYWSVPCGGISPGAQATWQTDCPANQYLQGSNTNTTSKICQNCTTSKQRYYLPNTTCSIQRDNGWLPCPLGSYCTGAPFVSPTSCPTDMTTISPAASLSECICVLGTYKTGLTTCAKKVCDNTTQLTDRPGNTLQSPQYMTLRQQVTDCVPCGTGAHATGSMLQMSSCVCDSSDKVFNAAQQCVPCATVSCTGGKVPLPCAAANGLAQRPCGCPMAPFTVPFTAGATCVSQCNTPCSTQCASLYTFTGDLPTNTLNVSGSGLYTRAQWSALLQADNTVTALHLTRNAYDASYDSQPFVLWATVSQPPYLYAGRQGQATFQSLVPGTVAAIVTSPFTESAPTTRNPIVIVGVLTALADQTLESLRLNTLSMQDYITIPQTSAWVQAVSFQSQAILVHFTHLALAWNANKQGEFCLIYNVQARDGYVLCQEYSTSQSGTVQQNGWSPSTVVQLSTAGCSGVVRAGTIQESQGDRVLYLVMGSDPTKVIRLVWASITQFVGPTDYFTAQDPTLLPLLGLTSLSQVDPLLLTLSADGQPYVMDTTQRQLVPVEGAPKVPLTLYAMSMQAENTTHTRVDMVAATESGLFQLQLFFCRKLTAGGKRTYWNGDTCAPVVCQRQAQCTETQTLVEGNCVCNPGYFAQGGVCVHCPLNYYCANQIRTLCPQPLVTTAMGQQSNTSCVCPLIPNAFFYSNSNCRTCAAPNFCPDQWHSVRCPGSALTNPGTGVAQTTPAACLCAPGSTGVDCGPCPEGKYCPLSSTNMQKTGLILYGQYNVDPDATALCVVTRLRSDLANSQSSFTDYTLWYNTAVRPDDMLSISLLFQSANAVPSQVANLADLAFGQPLPYIVPCRFNMESRFPATGLDIRQFAPNLPLPCDSGMVPAPGAASCICAAGYESNVAEGCSQCQLDYYKPEAGAGTCTPCASGTITLATGSSACVPQDQASRRRSAASRLWGRLYAVQMLFMLLATTWS